MNHISVPSTEKDISDLLLVNIAFYAILIPQEIVMSARTYCLCCLAILGIIEVVNGQEKSYWPGDELVFKCGLVPHRREGSTNAVFMIRKRIDPVTSRNILIYGKDQNQTIE